MHIHEYVRRKYFESKIVPESVLLFKQCAERYFGEENVMLDVGTQSMNEQAFEKYVHPEFVRHCRALWIRDTNRSYRNLTTLIKTVNEICTHTCRLAIIIHIPYKKITNENDLNTDLHDVFIKFQFTNSGRFLSRFQMLRTTYTLPQFSRGYIHSHVSSLDTNEIDSWKTPCTGSGPINLTMMELQRQGFLPDENTIQLFLWELDKFVGVESIEGGPYMRIESIGNNMSGITRTPNIFRFTSDSHMKEFLTSYIESKRMKLAFRNGHYILADTFDDWWMDISDYYIHWCNVNLKKRNINTPMLIKYIKAGKTISLSDEITLSSRCADFIKENDGILTLIKFNDVEYKFNILKQKTKGIEVHLLAYGFAYSLLFKILQIINYYHGKTAKEYQKTFTSRVTPETGIYIPTGKTIF